MRRRHPDERCGRCDAAPLRPCVDYYSWDFRAELAGGQTHFQPAGFTPELPLEAQAKSSGALGTPLQQTPSARLIGALEEFVRWAAPDGTDISNVRVVGQRDPLENGVYHRTRGVWFIAKQGRPAPGARRANRWGSVPSEAPCPDGSHDWSDKSVRARLSAARGNGGGK